MEKTRKEKLRDAGVAKYGSEEAWRQAMREFGAQARRDTPRGFAVMSEKVHKEISRKGSHARWEKYRAEKEGSTEE